MTRKSKSKAEPALEKRNLDDLRPHEKQDAYFEDLSGPELRRLADSIERNGLETPIQITPDNRITKGNQRARACKLLGWTEVEVRVRYDLEGDETKIEYELLSDNLDRRQMGPIEIARCYRRLKGIEREKSGGKRKHAGRGDLRDLVGKKFNMTGRNLDSLEKVLDTPEAVQWAVVKKFLPLHTALKIAQLPADKQEELAHEIDDWKEGAGSDKSHLKRMIKGVVKECLSATSSKSKSGTKRANRVTTDVTAANKSVTRILREAEKMAGPALARSLPKLKETHDMLGRVIAKAETRNSA